jgi:hypothetical protein
LDEDLENPVNYAVVKIAFARDLITFSSIIYNKFSLVSDSGKYGTILVLGVTNLVTSLTINGRDTKKFQYNQKSKELVIQSDGISETILDSFTIKIT